MKILAFGASYSSDSINRKLAGYAANKFDNHSIEIVDLTKFDLPLFTVDVEATTGQPEAAVRFLTKIEHADLIIISLAEHNGSYAAAFKNLFDWVSRIKMKMFADKKLLLLSTSPGALGGVSVLAAAEKRFPRHGAEIVGTFSLPDFHQNFNEKEGITNDALKQKFLSVISDVQNSI